MKPGLFELRGAYALFSLLALDSFLVVLLVPRPAAYWVLLPLLLVQLGAAWLALRVVNVVRDHRLLKESYEQELDFARQIMESVDHGLTVLDNGGRYVYVNSAYADLLGLPVSEIVGRTPFDFTVHEDHIHLKRARDVRHQGHSDTYRTRLKRVDGSEIEVQITGTPRLHHGRMVGDFTTVVPIRAELVN
ncbi:PAS domain-containing protein [Deinococcus sp. KSM4-11]|uniref:PAS domain-containing protein n=1 Tax=Deinococcus sp. KSM4-11 TaxID=2568654 RepID=UPI0010A4302C|nr:PAS domain-containing protein [Deinococcus sp. KSM4-11]THF83637.1 PAS domain-containing protein [Deinococcus sp. KSM4-11]